MANDIPAYDAHTPVPWNTDSGKVAGGTDRAPVELAFTTDIRQDPGDTDNDCDPAVGWKLGVSYGSQTV